MAGTSGRASGRCSVASGYRLTEHRSIQIEAELRSPPFDHRASVDWGTGPVDEAWKTHDPWRFVRGGGMRTGAAAVGGNIALFDPAHRVIRGRRRPDGGGDRQDGTSPLSTRPGDGRSAEDGGAIPTEHRPFQVAALEGLELRFPPFDHRASVFPGDRRRGRSVENARPLAHCSRRAMGRPEEGTSPLSSSPGDGQPPAEGGRAAGRNIALFIRRGKFALAHEYC